MRISSFFHTIQYTTIGCVLLLCISFHTVLAHGDDDDATSTQTSILAQTPKRPYLEKYTHSRLLNYYLSGGVGLTAYTGDLNVPSKFNRHRQQMDIGAGYRFTHYISLQLEVHYMRIYGEAEGTWNNKSVFSNSLEYSVSIVHDLFPKSNYDRFFRKWNGYGFVGIGQVIFEPKDGVTKEKLRTEANYGSDIYSNKAIVIPFGVGVKYYVYDNMSIAFEASYRSTNTDYLDDASDPDDPEPKNDGYFIYGFKLNWQLIGKYNYNKHLRQSSK